MDGHGPSVDRRTLLAGVGTGAVALAGCSSASGRSSERHLRIGTVQPPIDLDPFSARDVGSAQAINRVFDGLYTYGTGTDVVPALATDAPTHHHDGSVTVEIGEDRRFQDGKAVTSEDVKYSFEAPAEEDEPAKWRVSPVASVEAVDDRTVRFHLDHPTPTLDHVLTQPIVPKHVREDDPTDFGTDPVGAGPYRVTSFSEGKTVDLARWDDYWGRPEPAVDSLTMAYVESPITQLTSLVSNRTDAVEPISPRYRDEVESLTGASAAERPGFRSLYFGFNTNEGPAVQKVVREGIVRCIDREKVVYQFVEPEGHTQSSLLPRQVTDEWGFPVDEWANRLPPKDTEQAKQYLGRAEGSVGTIRILTTEDPVKKELAEALASGLRDAQQPALVEKTSTKEFVEKAVSGSASDYSVFVGEVAGNGDPDSFLYPVFHENVEGLTNGIFYHDEDVMNALSSARRTTDRGHRKSLYDSAVRTLLAERVHLPISSFHNSFALERSVQDFRVHPIAQLNPRMTSPDGAVHVGAAGGGGR